MLDVGILNLCHCALYWPFDLNKLLVSYPIAIESVLYELLSLFYTRRPQLNHSGKT